MEKTRKWFFTGLLIAGFSLSGEKQGQTPFDRQGSYLGQPTPGAVPTIFAPGIVSTGCHEMDIAMSPDLKEIYFTRSGLDWYSAIILIRWMDNHWSSPMMTSFSGLDSINYPFVSPDGMKIFFDSQGETPGSADRDIWVAHREGMTWSSPRRLESDVNTQSTESFCGVAANGNLYFCARREEGLGGMDIFIAKKKEDGYEEPENLGPAVNSGHNDFHPFIDPDEGFLLFDSQRPGGFGANDLYISFRRGDGTWTSAVNLGEGINTSYADMRPYVSPDEKYLFFCSNRKNILYAERDHPLTFADFMLRIDGPGLGSQDIYWVDARFIDKLNPDLR